MFCFVFRSSSVDVCHMFWLRESLNMSHITIYIKTVNREYRGNNKSPDGLAFNFDKPLYLIMALLNAYYEFPKHIFLSSPLLVSRFILWFTTFDSNAIKSTQLGWNLNEIPRIRLNFSVKVHRKRYPHVNWFSNFPYNHGSYRVLPSSVHKPT